MIKFTKNFDINIQKRQRKVEIQQAFIPADSYAHLFQSVLTVMSELDNAGSLFSISFLL